MPHLWSSLPHIALRRGPACTWLIQRICLRFMNLIQKEFPPQLLRNLGSYTATQEAPPSSLLYFHRTPRLAQEKGPLYQMTEGLSGQNWRVFPRCNLQQVQVFPRISHLERRPSASNGDKLPEGSPVQALTTRKQQSRE